MFTGSTKSPPTKTPQPERLDEVYSALRRGLQSHLQVHQMELESLGQQIRENKRNGRLGSLYELDKQVKGIERFMRRLEFHLSKVEELYDAYCIQRRLRDGASKMVAAFNTATGSREARESLSEANKGYREYTEHMCSLETEIESQMGEFHIKMKGLAGFARLCAGDQYEVLMRYGRQRWRLRGRVEVSNKQVWDSEEYVFLPLVTELLSIKVTELKSLANHVVVGSVSCEMLDLFCPLPQTLAVDINDLGTVKLNLEVTWSPFDKDDLTSSSSTVSKRLLSNQSPPDTPSMREQVFYCSPARRATGAPRRSTPGQQQGGWSLVEAFRDTVFSAPDRRPTTPGVRRDFVRTAPPRFAPRSQLSLLKRQGDQVENGTVWSNSSESSDDSSSPALAHHGHAQRLASSSHAAPQTTPTGATCQLSFSPSRNNKSSSASTPSLSSINQEEEDEPEVFAGGDGVPNGHLLLPSQGSSCGGAVRPDCTAAAADTASVRSAGSSVSESSENLSRSYPDVSAGAERPEILDPPAEFGGSGGASITLRAQEGGGGGGGGDDGASECSDVRAEKCEAAGADGAAESASVGEEEEEEEEECPSGQQSTQESKQPEDTLTVCCHSSSFSQEVETALESFDFLNCSDLDDEEEEEEEEAEEKEEDEEKEEEKEKELQEEDAVEEAKVDADGGEDVPSMEEVDIKAVEQEGLEEPFYADGSDEEEEGEELEIFMEPPEGFRNSDEDCFSQSPGSSMENLTDLGEINIPEDEEEEHSAVHSEERPEEKISQSKETHPSTPTNLATTVL